MRQGMAWGTWLTMSRPFVLPEVHRRAQQRSISRSADASVEALPRGTDLLLSHHREAAQRFEREIERITQPFNAVRNVAIAALSGQISHALEIALPASPLEQLLEADRKRWTELTNRLNPSLGLLSANALDLQIPTFNQHLASASFPAPSLYGFGEADPEDDLHDANHDDVVIHARPAGQSASPPQPDRLERLTSPFLAVGGRNLFSGVGLEATPRQSIQLEKHLEAFLTSDEVGPDPKEGIAGLIAWIKVKDGPSTDAEGRELNRLIRLFLRGELQLDVPPEALQIIQLRPASTGRSSWAHTPELGEEAFTSQQLAKKLAYNDSTLRRNALQAFQRGPLPQPLKCAPSIFVVEAPFSEGGRGKGWKFRERIT